jgi:hypothetical protein
MANRRVFDCRFTRPAMCQRIPGRMRPGIPKYQSDDGRTQNADRALLTIQVIVV